ncbi:MAG TPA: hypothetical protein VL945_02040, partial [Candidatus Saccharimonadales bacterium]|nr:hypothetical protein [Candidatus Saccharimonadales bacterium]
MMDGIRIRIPATSANLGSGFDICGIALAEPFDEMEVSLADRDSIRSVGDYPVSDDLGKNTCGPVLSKMRADFGLEGKGLAISIKKGIKPSGGMGSSAASAAGMAYAIDRLFGLGLDRNALAEYASLGETVSAGSPHLDNVAPAIFGGFTVIARRDPLKIRKVEVSDMLEVIILSPEKGKSSTREARE